MKCNSLLVTAILLVYWKSEYKTEDISWFLEKRYCFVLELQLSSAGSPVHARHWSHGMFLNIQRNVYQIENLFFQIKWNLLGFTIYEISKEEVRSFTFSDAKFRIFIIEIKKGALISASLEDHLVFLFLNMKVKKTKMSFKKMFQKCT